MPFCGSCGSRVADAARFCTECGTAVPFVASQTEQADLPPPPAPPTVTESPVAARSAAPPPPAGSVEAPDSSAHDDLPPPPVQPYSPTPLAADGKLKIGAALICLGVVGFIVTPWESGMVLLAAIIPVALAGAVSIMAFQGKPVADQLKGVGAFSAMVAFFAGLLWAKDVSSAVISALFLAGGAVLVERSVPKQLDVSQVALPGLPPPPGVAAPQRRTHPPADKAGATAGDVLGAGADGLVSLIKVVAVFATLAAGVWAYSHTQSDEFKFRCSAHKLGFDSMGFIDAALCDTFYERK